jgi:5-oxoprolinase (ATP-hydrolysing) subunit A
VKIDLNADVGEGGDDRSLMPYLTSVNVACGGHCGDARTMAETVEAAASFGLAIGAHPSYPDREHFGRRDLALPPAELAASLAAQIDALARVAAARGARLAHVKPHGALYNRAARDGRLAELVAGAVVAVDRSLRLVGLAGSRLLDAARAAGLEVAAEAFADRRYAPDGSLASRALPEAVVSDPDAAAAQALSIVRDHRVAALDGTDLELQADTLCIHGDTPGAPSIARAVRARLARAGVTIAPPPHGST